MIQSIPIKNLFNVEKGNLQSLKNTEGDFTFITASEDWKTNKNYTHDCEALVFAMGAGGSLGRTHYVNGKFIASDLCFILTQKQPDKFPVNLKFYFLYFNFIRNDLVEELARGAAKKAINKTNFGNYEIPYIDIKKQNTISEKGFTLSQKIKEINLVADKIKSESENLLNKMIYESIKD